MKFHIQFPVVVAALFVSVPAFSAESLMRNPTPPSDPVIVDDSSGVVPADVTLYDDPRYPDQRYWDVLTDRYKGRSEIEPVHEAFQDHPKETVRVAVLDGGFYDSPDIEWAGGVNLSGLDSDKGIEVGDDFRQHDRETCDNSHGQGVASIIGAVADNNRLHSGIVDAELYGVRVLGCNNTGLPSDVAEGIYWAAAHESHEGLGYPTLDEPVDVMNISISGDAYNGCPQATQDAIDYAVSQGVTIVVAAGNAQKPASEVSPANCDGVITVAAVDNRGDQAYFSNYGEAIDASAQGVEVVASYGTSDDGGYLSALRNGTSFSSPIVAGIVAYMRALTGNDSPAEDQNLVSASATGFASTDEKLGPGVLNAPLMAENAFGPEVDQGMTAEQVLADPTRCNNALFTDHSPISVPVCELYELNYEGAIDIPDGYELMVFEADADNPLAAEADNLIKGSSDSTFVFNPSNPSGDHAIQVCRSGVTDCKGSLVPIDVVTTISCSDSQAVAQAKRRAVAR